MNTVAQPHKNFNPNALPNGAKYRCCGCLNWSSTLGGIGVWVPNRNSTIAIRYPICPSCAAKVERGGKKAKQVATTAESYLRDRLEEAKAVAK